MNSGGAEYRRFVLADSDALVSFLTSERWPFHVESAPAAESIRERVADGVFDGPTTQTWWIVDDGHRVGLIRLFDLDDDTPMFDLRIMAVARGRGLGSAALGWLTRYVFETLPTVNRIEGTTRQDNAGMRNVFRRNGYAKESHYRQSWPGPGSTVQGEVVKHDAVGFAILRTDFETGTVTPVDFSD